MIDRRHFLKYVGGAAVGSSLTSVVMGFSTSDDAMLDIFVADSTLAESRMVGQLARSRGIETVGFKDIESLWYETLRPRCCSADAPVVGGLTNPSVAFHINMLARDVFYYTAFHGRHRSQADGRILHELKVPVTSQQACELILAEGGAWPAQLGHALFNLSGKSKAPSVDVRVTSEIQESAMRMHLASWVIAPMNPGRGKI